MFPEVFYQTMAQLCFTLLGLWWLVLQTKYAEWIGSASHRRRITDISLYFLLPGSMSLLALLASSERVIWQGAFVVAGVVGAVEAVLMLTRGPSGGWGSRLIRIVALVLFVLIALIAIAPDTARSLGLVPLTVTGIMAALLVLLGLVLAWLYFIEPMEAVKPS